MHAPRLFPSPVGTMDPFSGEGGPQGRMRVRAQPREPKSASSAAAAIALAAAGDGIA